MNKRERLKEMARYRREHVPSGYKGIGEYHDGAYECDFVSPTRNPPRPLMPTLCLFFRIGAAMTICEDRSIRF